MNNKIQWGKKTVLGKEGTPRSVIWQKWEALQEKAEDYSLRWLLDEYISSVEFDALTKNTKAGYQKIYLYSQENIYRLHSIFILALDAHISTTINNSSNYI